MDYFLSVVALVITTASAIAIHLLSRAKKSCTAKLPPGSMGLPVIGQTLGILLAVRANTIDRWIRDRIDRYGPVSKASLLCTPTVLLAGPAGNKFLFFRRELGSKMPRSFQRIFGAKSILDLHGDDHRRIRGALLEFLKPDALKLSTPRVDAKVRLHIEKNWYGGHATTITKVLPMMKLLTFDVVSSLLFGIESGVVRDELAADYGRMLEGMVAIPVQLPFTAFSRSLKASRRARRLLEEIMRDKKAKLRQGKSLPNTDLITRLLSLTDHQGQQLLTDEEIIDSSLFSLVVGHDSTSVLMSFMMRHLANNPATLAATVKEHEEIARNKADGEDLTWEDLSKMKLTWQVAQETLRIDPPAFGTSRRAFEDVEFAGYRIPKGWQVLSMAKVTHMDPTIFHEPAKFDASRFDSQSSVIPPYTFVPFGGGPRVCPGIEFTKIETLVMMHNIVRKFRWKLCCKENTSKRDPMLLPIEDLQIQLEPKIPL